MQIWDDIDPVELTGYVRTALADREQNQFTLSRFLPSKQIADLNYRFNSGGTGLWDAATFRTFDAESPIGNRPSAARKTGELPPISRKIRLGEYDQLRLRNADQEIQDAVFNDGRSMTMQIAARLELARGEALHSGKVVLAENGVTATVDFGRSGTHSVTTSISWATVASAVPLTDLLLWQGVYNATNGENPGLMLISTQTLGYMLRNTEIKGLLSPVPSTITRVSQANLRDLLTDHGLPQYEVYDAQVRVNGSGQRIIPIDKIVFLPGGESASQLGATLWGIPAGALDGGGFTGTDQAGVYAAAYKETAAPHGVWTEAEAVSIPVVANPDLTFTADVIP